jgi:hypothetical protein
VQVGKVGTVRKVLVLVGAGGVVGFVAVVVFAEFTYVWAGRAVAPL